MKIRVCGVTKKSETGLVIPDRAGQYRGQGHIARTLYLPGGEYEFDTHREISRRNVMKSILIAGLSTLALLACQQAEQRDVSATATVTAHQMNKDNPMQYTEAGKTDADHLWLEEVEGKQALAKVRAWNAASEPLMQNQVYRDMKAELLEVYNSPGKIPYVSYKAGKVHNFWQDDKHVRGIWRRTTLDSYRSDNPEWETVLDIDALAQAEGRNWVYKGNEECLAPDYVHCIVDLSDGGKDAVERREFNAKTKSFVRDGFNLPESKGFAVWLDQDRLIVGVDFGKGTMTDSGYPRQVKLWTRGTPLREAKLLYEVDQEDIGGWGDILDTGDGSKEIVLQKSLTFYKSEFYILPQQGEMAWKRVRIPVPEKSGLGGNLKGQQILSLQEDWRGYKAGSLVSFSMADFLKNGEISTLYEIFSPAANQSVEDYGVTRSKVLMAIFEDVKGAGYAFDFDGSQWTRETLDLPENGTVSISSTNDKEDIAFISTESLLSPDTYWALDTADMQVRKYRALPHWFDSNSMVAKQHFVLSGDGTKIPYFIVHKKGMTLDGKNPTVLYGYGGFRISILPTYSVSVGRAWLDRGGVYVIANIRGGAEYGPAWHQAGLKENRQVIYDDFIAIAEDLIARGVTGPEYLGIHGRSNGGLLMGVMFTQRPDLFKSIAIGVPLLDMRRYHKLLAGASWVGEYGDPESDGAEGEFIRKLSPYHNVRTNVDYPTPYIYTSTKDDRVHPGHGRKFAQRLEDMGYPFLYYENIDGGHAGAANLEETAHSQALIYSYFANMLMD